MVQGLKRFQQIGLLVAVMVASALVTGPVAAQGTAGKAVTASEVPSPNFEELHFGSRLTPIVIKGASQSEPPPPRAFDGDQVARRYSGRSLEGGGIPNETIHKS